MSWDGRQAIFDKAGHPMTEKDAAESTEMVWTIIEQAMKYSNDQSSKIPVEKSLYHYFQEQLESMVPSQSEDDLVARKKRESVLGLAEMWGAFVGSPIQTQSLKFFWLEECIDGENLFVAETYHKVLQKIAEPALVGANIKFEAKVNKIRSGSGDESTRPTIETAAGQDETFDEVVATVPLGWLKHNKHNAFEPELPPRLQQAIESIGYGHLDKVYITFPTAFWDTRTSEDASTTTTSHNTVATPNVPATTAPHHQPSTQSETPASTHHYPGFTHWTSPYYAKDTNPDHWNQECVNLASLPGSTAQPTLLFYTFGPTSLHIASLLKQFPSPRAPEAQALLKDFFHPYYSRLPNYDPARPEHEPKYILATAWANDELAGYGSYCNFQTGLERGDEDVEVMRHGMPERGVWLAGEHTAPFVALGTVTGAYWAGEGVAKRIVKLYGLDKSIAKDTEKGEDGAGVSF